MKGKLECCGCYHENKSCNDTPCNTCFYGSGKTFLNHYENKFLIVDTWMTEEKNCETCYYEELPIEEEICTLCSWDCDNWKPKKTSPDYMADPVNNPTHYTAGGIETIDFIAAKLTPEQLFGYYLGTVIKYVSRCNFKSDCLQDLEKALWFLKKAIELMKGAE